MDKDKRRRSESRKIGERQRRKRSPEELEIEAGFQKWVTLVCEHLGRSYSWHGPFANDLEKINAIDAEPALLAEVAPEWSTEEFYSAQTSADADTTKGSEHYVTR